MNARLSHTDPEILHRQTETCSAVAFLLLETSSKYFDLQIGAARSSLENFRSQFDLLASPAEGKDLLAGYGSVLEESLNAGGRLLSESLALSTGCQRELGMLMDQGWMQMKESAKNSIEEQLAFARRIGQSISPNAR